MAAQRQVVFLFCAFSVLLVVHAVTIQPESIEGARRGVFDPKLDRAEAIHKSWIDAGYEFQTITDADHPYGFCMFGQPYEVKYSVTIPSDSAFLRVDKQPGYAGVLCNLDHTDLEFHFGTESEATQFMKMAASGHPVLTGEQGKAECTPNKGMFKRVALVNSSIITVPNSPFKVGGDQTTYTVRVRSFTAAYDHVIKSGTVQFGKALAGSPFADVCDRPQGPAHFCIGLNTDNRCTAAAGPIVFYQNEYVTLECSNCWLAFSMDVGLKMKLQDFLLYDSQFLFDNMVVNGALVAEMDAQYHWGLSYDATIPIFDQTNLVQFWIGPIPIIIGFELPLQRVADASFDASAQAQAGAIMQWNLGAYQVLWDPVLGWRAVKNEPGLRYKTVISGEAQFSGSANFGLAPSLTAYLDSFFTTEVEFSAMLHANIQGSTSTKQICANVNYEVVADGSATLDISIPWVDLDESWTWSKTWFSKSGTIAQACVGANATTTTTPTHNNNKPKELKLPVAPVAPKKTVPQQPQQPQRTQHNKPLVDGPTKFMQGKHAGCFGKRGYSMSYEVVMEESYNLIDLTTLGGLRKLECNAGGNNFRMEFKSDNYLKSFSKQVSQYTTFLTGNKALSDRCHGLYDTTVFLFRVQSVTDTSIPLIKYQVEVAVDTANYDEVFKHANMSLNPDEAVLCGGDDDDDVIGAPKLHDHVCLGVNTDRTCSAAKKDLVLYQGDQLTVDCTNCFFALQSDIFFELKIKDYWLSSLSGGFSNMSLNAAMVLDVMAKNQWNSGTNITEDAVPPTTIVDFMLGPIPVRIWFEIPLRRLAEIQINIAASVTAGVTTEWLIGDYYVSYEVGKGWTHAVPHPNLYWKPEVKNVQASFNATALLGLIPTFGFHVDSVFWTELTLDPELLISANGSLATKTMCAAAQSHVTASAYAELDINVPFIYLHIGAWWGPETIYDSGVYQIGSVCHTFAVEDEDTVEPQLLLSL